MKVHYLITSLETGGAGTSIPAIVDVLRERGHAVEITACEPRDAGAARLLDAASIPYRCLFPAHRSKLRQALAFSRVLQQSRPDVIWTMLNGASLVGAIAGARLRIPVVSWKNSSRVRVYGRFVARRCGLWIADSSNVAGLLEQRLHVAPDRIAKWPLFRQLVLPQPPQPWDGRGVMQVGSIGVLHPRKNYHLLIEAVARLAQAHPDLASRLHVTIAGEGAQRPRLERLIGRHRLGAMVSLPGAISDPRPFLATLHLYVQPSRHEGMGIALHEAMSAGLPVVATRVGEMPCSILASGGGVLLGDDIVASCADTLASLMAHPERLASMGAAAKAYIEATYSAAAFHAAGVSVVRRIEALVASQARPPRPT